MSSAAKMIAALGLQPHPEGGWYRETWRAPPSDGEARSAATAILFLLEAGQCSRWHRVDAAELWIFQAGAPLTLRTASGEHGACGVVETRLGADPSIGQAPQHLVQPHEWQAAQAGGGWTLVTCVVVPGFSFDGFKLAPEGWTPG